MNGIGLAYLVRLGLDDLRIEAVLGEEQVDAAALVNGKVGHLLCGESH